MSDQPRFLAASALSLDALADLFTRSFEAYFYPGVTTTETLAARIRTENLDLYRSQVMLLNDEPVGLALLGLRGDRAWCGGFGVTLPFRGRGLSRHLIAALIEQARQANARSFGLEVLTRNERAIKTYTRAGLSIQRDLLILEWRTPVEAPATNEPASLHTGSPTALLARFAALHPVPAAWQSDLPALLVRGNLQGAVLMVNDETTAYALYAATADGGARIADLGAANAEDAGAILRALQNNHTSVTSVNEPSDSPLLPAFFVAGFVETDRQHEMLLAL